MGRMERGAAAVEMAVMMIFLLPVLIGLIDVGRLIYSHIAVQEAAQEGALLASFDEAITVAAIEDRVIASTSFPDLSVDTTILVSCATESRDKAPGAVVTVDVSHVHDMLLPFTGTATIAKTAATDRFFGSCPS